MTPQVCVGAIAVFNGSLLLVRRANEPGAGEWSLPGGRVESGELLAEAVVRELREETGLEGVCGSLVGVAERIGAHGHFVILDHQVTVLDPAMPVAASDASDVRWAPLEDVAGLRLVEGLAEFLHDHGILRTIV
jgi:8-oxo-dGTP diphosphatase